MEKLEVERRDEGAKMDIQHQVLWCVLTHLYMNGNRRSILSHVSYYGDNAFGTEVIHRMIREFDHNSNPFEGIFSRHFLQY